MLRDFEIFRTVMTSGSASKAAALLGISQPGVSQCLRKLEVRAGLALFQRVRGRLVPTPEAQALHAEIERSFVGLDAIEHRLRSLRQFGVGRLSLASYPAFGMGFLPRVLARYGLLKRETTASLQIMSSRDVRARVLAGQCDLGLMADEASTVGMEHSEFARAAGVVVMPARHKLARKQVIEAHDLSGVPFISLNPEDAARRRLDAAMALHGEQIRTVVETPYAITACELVLRGVGLGIVHPLTALEGAERGLVLRRFALEVPFSCILALPPGKPMSEQVQVFVGDMRRQLGVDMRAVEKLLD